MNYFKIYAAIISIAECENRVKYKLNDIRYKYYEKHHILPKCMGGGEEKSNKVLLTAKEHFICHLLLCEMFPKEIGLTYAIWKFCYNQRNLKISSKLYERIKTIISLNMSENNPCGVDEHNSNYGNKWTQQQRDSLSKKMIELGHSKGDKNYFYGKHFFGINRSDKSGKNNPNYGNKLSQQQKDNHSKFMKGRFVGKDNPNYGNGDKIKGDKNPNIDGRHSIGKKNGMFGKVVLTNGTIRIVQCKDSPYPDGFRNLQQKVK